MIKTYKDLQVFQASYGLAMDIFHTTRNFPKEEIYSLTSQIVRSSRSVGANLAEGWGKRSYENYFKQHMIHSLGSNSETEFWIDVSKDCGYINAQQYSDYMKRNEEVGRMLTRLHQKWETY